MRHNPRAIVGQALRLPGFLDLAGDAPALQYKSSARSLPREGHSSFGISNCSIDVFERTHAPSAFVVFGALELSARRTQVLQSCPHVRLISPNRIQTGGSNYGNDSQTDFQYFHPARSKQFRHEIKLRNCFRMDAERVIS